MYLKDVKHVSKGKRVKSCVSNIVWKRYGFKLWRCEVSNYEDVKFHCFLTKKTNNAMTFPNIFFGLNIYHDCYLGSLWNEWLIKRGRRRRRMETMVLTWLAGAVLPLHEQLINVPEPSVLKRTPPPCCVYGRYMNQKDL